MILKGRYCIIEQIGSGGEGTVYLCRDLEMGTLWAVKELPVENKKEAKLMRLLGHPGLPQMIDYAERESYCYLVMEYIKGKNLQQMLDENRQFSLDEILMILISASEILDYLHRQKPPVYYGDFKPENLMLSEHGKLYLIDLGSAVEAYDERTRVTRGTIGYASPEQYDGKVKKSSDIYALGKTLIKLMGKEKLRYFLQKPELFWFVFRCCQSRENWRYQDMGTVRKALREIQKSQNHVRTWNYLPMVLFGMMLFLIVFSLLFAAPDFYQELTEKTSVYYENTFKESSAGEKRTICLENEKGLQRIVRNYTDSGQQRRLYLMLAANAELAGEWERAAIYYEQLLLYEPDYREGYVEYGCFLMRIGQSEESKRLWEAYQKKSEDGELETERSENVLKWEREMKKF